MWVASLTTTRYQYHWRNFKNKKSRI